MTRVRRKSGESAGAEWCRRPVPELGERQRAQSDAMILQIRTAAVAAARCGRRAVLLASVVSLLAACASRSVEVAPKPTDPAAYVTWNCERLHDEIDAVQFRAADVAYAVDARAGNNLIALGLGVTVFWPALLAMRPDGPESDELAELKGRYEALNVVSTRQACGPPPEAMPARRATALPVALGDRLVYEERIGHGAATRQLGLQVTALRRDQIEYRVDLDGRAFDAGWRQDRAGNVLLDARAPLIGWRQLLKTDLVLGQVLSGELAAADENVASARVRGQVVATGEQSVAGRRFDVAVIELFGESPNARGSADDIGQTSARLDGVMAVDRSSGLLLRLEVRSSNADFAVRRRLLRIESAAR